MHDSVILIAVIDRTANLLAATAQLVDDAVARRVERVLPRTGSAPAALVTIAHFRGLSIEQLRRALGLTHPGAVRLVNGLEADGLLRREKRDARSVSLELTRRGAKVVERLEQARLDAVRDVLAPLSAAQQRQLEPLLAAVLGAQTHDDHDLRRICRLCSFEACESRGRACPVAAAL
jgi:DNA-binding MarR family transcriptional regulator